MSAELWTRIFTSTSIAGLTTLDLSETRAPWLTLPNNLILLLQQHAPKLSDFCLLDQIRVELDFSPVHKIEALTALTVQPRNVVQLRDITRSTRLQRVEVSIAFVQWTADATFEKLYGTGIARVSNSKCRPWKL